MTKIEWLAFAFEHRQEILSLIADYHPLNRGIEGIPHGAGEDIAMDAELACQNIRKLLREEAYNKPGPIETPTVTFSKALDAHDVDKIMKVLWDTWFGVPESQSFAWSLVGFKEAVVLLEGIDDDEDERGIIH